MHGIFAIDKPSGISSSRCISDLQHIFTNSAIFQDDLNEMKDNAIKNLSTDKSWSKERINKKVSKIKIKIGHGGTLDPLASGVLVVGLGSGTKRLQHYLGECNKVYETKALLGISTTTGDSEGEILTRNQVDHITADTVKQSVQRFIGDIKQTPPIFSALKMNGKPLYDYAREGKPLPFPIKTRDVKVPNIFIHPDHLLSREHGFEPIKSQLDDNGEPKENALFNNPTLNDSPLYFSSQYLQKCEDEGLPKTVGPPRLTKEPQDRLPMVHLTCDVSSGTYIRSLISDIGRAMESSAYMVELIRVEQSEWKLGKNTFKFEDFHQPESVWAPVLKRVLEEGDKVNVSELMDAAVAAESIALDPDTEESQRKRPITEVE
ncbi:pseudouridine synthase pus4 [Yamadazyma tenuis]|nr:pseudouridine synthase pus4 [Yamadazyma tenuis]